MSKYNIPAEYERYNDVVDNLVDEYTRLVEEDLVTFESNDIMVLLALLGKTINRLREVVEDMKDVSDSDKVALYTLMLGLIIEKSVMASEQLTEEQKEQVQSAFGENGIFQSLLSMFNTWFKGKLKDMDSNNDKKVTRKEYVDYLFRQNKKSCPCLGDEANRRSAECSANCCFPFLSGGDGLIDLEDEVEDEPEPEPTPEPTPEPEPEPTPEPETKDPE
jgi:hypothetical protein